jgi:UDP-glucose 4-epimerase
MPHAKMAQTRWDSVFELEQICKNIDAVIHLSGMNAQDCASDPVAALEINGMATCRLLQASVRQGVKRFIYVSTAHVYGSALSGTITEETNPVSLHPYATSHRVGEDVVRAANERGEIEGFVIRLSNAFGAPVNANTNCWMLLVNDLCRQALTTKQMVLRSSGLQRRNFIPLSDACRAIAHVLQLSGNGELKDIYNVGGLWSPTIIEMAQLIQKRCSALLDFQPKLMRNMQHADVASVEFKYCIDALLKTGFHPIDNKVEEIDELLKFCKDLFL